jgi:asparagine synthase (glutamine-hydrolysing)
LPRREAWEEALAPLESDVRVIPMCGICGFINLGGETGSEVILAEMTARMEHRGPDGAGTRVFGDVALGHRRLSIIDIEGGVQPMSNEDGSIHIVFNGEIYNHRELRARLEAKGHTFKTQCDTEAIIHLYEDCGNNCVEHLEGMFAFAIYDANRKKLFLARDRLGQKPLVFFYREKPGGAVFAFASELHALRAHPDMPREIDPQALHDYLSLQYVPAPNTIYKGVNKLPPAFTIEVGGKNPLPKATRYWNCRFDEKFDLDLEPATEKLRTLLFDATKKRLMSDVPLGAFLSGGLDSTIIAVSAAKHTLLPLDTFSIGFPEENYDERHYARMAADSITSNHREQTADPSDISILETLVLRHGEPFSDASMLPTFLLSRFVKKHVSVALSGDGADELFAGYNRYVVMKFARYADIIPEGPRSLLANAILKTLPQAPEERSELAHIRRTLAALASNPRKRHLDIVNRFPENAKRSVYSKDFAAFAFQDTQRVVDTILSDGTAVNQLDKCSEVDIHSYLPGDILAKVDIASMANSLETRSPFLDHKVVEFAAALDPVLKSRFVKRKRVLSDAFSAYVPKEILSRKKMGFGVPVAKWLRNEWKKTARGRLLDGKAVGTGYFDRSALETMLDAHQSGKADYSYPIWSVLVFEYWLSSETADSAVSEPAR